MDNVGHYKIIELVGKGGMGSVYLGVDTRTNTRVAIKVLRHDMWDAHDNVELVERLRREGEALRKLNHPNIVKILDMVEDNSHLSLVLEYVEGGTLWDILKEYPNLPLQVTLRVALELCDALTRAHHLRIIHRDIKPSNIMFAQDGSLRLTDFGVARLEQVQELTQSGMMVGSVPYLSPEAIRGAPPSVKVDIWAFGVVLYEMVAGQRPFHGSNMTDLIDNIIRKPVPELKKARQNVPPRLNALVKQMLSKDPDTRIQSVRQIAAEVDRILTELNIETESVVTASQRTTSIPDTNLTNSTIMLYKIVDHLDEFMPTQDGRMTPSMLQNSRVMPSMIQHSQQRRRFPSIIAALVLTLIIGGVWFLSNYNGGSDGGENTPNATLLGVAADSTEVASATPPTPTIMSSIPPTINQRATDLKLAQTRSAETEQAKRDATLTATFSTKTFTPTLTPSKTPRPPATATLKPTATPTTKPSRTPRPTATPTIAPGYTGGAGITLNGAWNPQVSQVNGVNMVLVPIGCFTMGSTIEQSNYIVGLGNNSPNVADEQPTTTICFEEPFWFDQYEVTNQQFKNLGGTASSTSNWTNPNRPRERITWSEAQAFCEKRGGRLPTEAEWEYAARGPESWIFPWGDVFGGRNVIYFITSSNQTADVASKSGGVSWVGAYDLSGNVWEWVLSEYRDYPYVPNDGREDVENLSALRSIRGGSWFNNLQEVHAANRGSGNPNNILNVRGFRCMLPYSAIPDITPTSVSD